MRSVQGMQDMAFPTVRFPNFLRGSLLRNAFGADSALVSPVTLVLNVQLQKTPHLDKTNDDTEKQWSKIYIILVENRSLDTT